MNEKALAVTQQSITLAGDLSGLKARYDTLKRATRDVLREGVDYGSIPGTKDQKTLLKPGAEKLSTLFGLRPDFPLQDKIEDWEQGRFYYRYKCLLTDPYGGFVASAEGSCNTMEKKYRWRMQDRACPVCGQETIIKGRDEYGGGWVCYRKKGGCGAKFKDGDLVIEGQTVGRIENPDIYDLVNTVQKMAQKRALVAAVLVATGASEFFTQDMEDIIDSTATETSPNNPAKRQNGATMKEVWDRWNVVWNEAKALGIEVQALPADSTREQIYESGIKLKAQIEAAEADKPPSWPAQAIAAVIEAGLTENSHSAINTLKHSTLTPDTDKETVVNWFRQYRAARDSDASVEDASAIANAWLAGESDEESTD